LEIPRGNRSFIPRFYFFNDQRLPLLKPPKPALLRWLFVFIQCRAVKSESKTEHAAEKIPGNERMGWRKYGSLPPESDLNQK
jgi:hypothetical protein